MLYDILKLQFLLWGNYFHPKCQCLAPSQILHSPREDFSVKYNILVVQDVYFHSCIPVFFGDTLTRDDIIGAGCLHEMLFVGTIDLILSYKFKSQKILSLLQFVVS